MHKPLLILFYCLLLFGAQASYAQKIMFTDTSNEWTYEYHNLFLDPLPPTFTTYRYSGDTTIKGLKYLRLLGVGFVREDTLSGKVYCIRGHDTVEYMLFNFSAKIGDTLAMGASCVVTVKSIATCNINGLGNKIFGTDYSLSQVIEEIGSYPEPFGIPCMHPDQWSSFVCFKNRGTVVTIANPIPSYRNIVDANSCALSVNSPSLTKSTTSIIPNPANESSVIRLCYNMHSGKLAIVNALGQTVMQKDIANTTELPIGDLHLPGMYFYRVTDNETNQSFTGKFMYQ